ncbi:MAG: hypothetical protein QG583_733 [Patescibacteria group bacterium]|nr:hypothetical protein [Patescibacteria group bacterium]
MEGYNLENADKEENDREHNIELIKKAVEKFSQKEVTITDHQGKVLVVGTLHSATFEAGQYINLVNIQLDKSSKEVLDKEEYYSPKNYNSEKGIHNFRFISDKFNEDPETTDLLVMPVHGCLLFCEDKVVEFA